MILITKEIQEAFDKQGDTSQKQASEIKVICKLFNPAGAGTWYLVEKENDDYCFGFANLGDSRFAELGSISLTELKSLTLPLGLHIERDRHFPIGKYTLQEVMDKVKSGVHV
jgi:hypothetical protein